MAQVMRTECSFGIVPLQKKDGVWQVLLIKHLLSNNWGFPKGKPIEGELPKESAVRELKEETALDVVRFLSDECLTEKYRFTRNRVLIEKSVTYFIAEVTGEIVLQKEELSASKWVLLSDADREVTFKENKRNCKKILDLLNKTSTT